MRNKFVPSEPRILLQDDQPEDELIRCLKRRHYFTAEGIVSHRSTPQAWLSSTSWNIVLAVPPQRAHR